MKTCTTTHFRSCFGRKKNLIRSVDETPSLPATATVVCFMSVFSKVKALFFQMHLALIIEVLSTELSLLLPTSRNMPTHVHVRHANVIVMQTKCHFFAYLRPAARSNLLRKRAAWALLPPSHTSPRALSIGSISIHIHLQHPASYRGGPPPRNIHV